MCKNVNKDVDTDLVINAFDSDNYFFIMIFSIKCFGNVFKRSISNNDQILKSIDMCFGVDSSISGRRYMGYTLINTGIHSFIHSFIHPFILSSFHSSHSPIILILIVKIIINNIIIVAGVLTRMAATP